MGDAAREISLPQHLWDSLETMAREMGVGRDSLVSQAVFTLARLNGYVIPGKVVLGASASSSASSVAVPQASTPAPAPALAAATPASKVAPAAAKPAPAPVPTPAPQPAPVRGKGKPAPVPEPEVPEEDQGNPFEEQPAEDEAPPEENAEEEEAPPSDAEDEAPAEDEEPPEENAEEDAPPEESEEEEPAPAPKKGGGGGGNLTVVMAGREPFKLTADSMLVGRGKHCDFVIESNRVSREHARIGREGEGFVLEDLNSSNGTFFGPGKEKVTRPRKLKDGDEYTFGTEKVKFRIGR